MVLRQIIINFLSILPIKLLSLFLLFKHWETLWTVPLPLGLVREGHAGEVEPLNGAVLIVTSYHLSIADLLAKTVCWLVRIHRHVYYGYISNRDTIGSRRDCCNSCSNRLFNDLFFACSFLFLL